MARIRHHTLMAPRAFGIESPIHIPVQRIDYLFHLPHFRAGDVRVVRDETGSDHRPVWARFDMVP